MKSIFRAAYKKALHTVGAECYSDKYFFHTCGFRAKAPGCP